MKIKLSATLVSLALFGCGGENTQYIYPYPANQGGITLSPFILSSSQGQTVSFDFAPYVNSTQPWRLISLVDANGRIDDVTIKNNTSASFQTTTAGVSSITWTIEQNGIQHTSQGVVSTSSTDSSVRANNLPLSTSSDAAIQIDVADLIESKTSPASHSNEMSVNDASIVTLEQSDERFVTDGSTITYTPNGFVGLDVARYAITDGQGGFDVGVISINVLDTALENDAPIASNKSVELAEGYHVIDISALVSDNSALVQVLGHSGRATMTGPTTIQYYAPNNDGSDSLIYVVQNHQGAMAQGIIDINLAASSEALPLTLSPITIVMDEGETQRINISDWVSSGLPYTLTKVDENDGLVDVTLLSDHVVELTARHAGLANKQYTVETEQGSQSQSFVVSVQSASAPAPTVANASFDTNSETTLSLNLADELSINGLIISSLIQKQDRFQFSGSTLTYTPSGFVGIDSAYYVAHNAQGERVEGFIAVEVSEANPSTPNNPPTAKNYTHTLNSDGSATIDLKALNLIGDADNDALTVSLFGSGSRASLADTVMTYSPQGFSGTEEVIYVLSDGQSSAVGAITFIVNDVSIPNTLPVAQAQTVTLSLQDILTQPERRIDVTSLVSDADGDTLSLTQVHSGRQPATVDSPLTIKYEASPSVESDSIMYVVSDGQGGFAHNTIKIEIDNTAPTAQPVSARSDGSSSSIDIDLASYISDVDGDSLTLTVDLSVVTAPATLTRSGTTLTYTPNGYKGAHAVPYSVTDGQKSSHNVIHITSEIPNDVTASDINAGRIAMTASPVTVDVSSHIANATQIDSVIGAQLGTVSTPNGLTFTYTPNNISYGTETLYYTVSGNNGSNTAMVTIDIEEPATPSITDLSLDWAFNASDQREVTTTVTCDDCDTTRTSYQFEIGGVLMGTDMATFTGTNFVQLGVTVTAKNAYCNADNTGINGSNACRVTHAKLIEFESEIERVEKIYTTARSFAALKRDGSVVTWGDSNYAADSSAPVGGTLANVETIYSTRYAFAALKTDGSVVTWGDVRYGGDPTSQGSGGDLTSDVETIYSTTGAFAALKTDGSVVTWGSIYDAGDSSTPVGGDLTDVKAIYSTSSAFAALKSDGSVVVWGTIAGGDPNRGSGGDLTSGVETIYSTGSAFAALKTDGSVVTWGSMNSDTGADSSTPVGGTLTNVETIYSTGRAFAALKTDGSVVTWGDDNYGGDPTSVGSGGTLTNVKTIYSTERAFAALKTDGSVVTWGDDSYGGDSSAPVGGTLINVDTIYSTERAFAATKTDGSVVTWGNWGGDSSAPIGGTLTNVETIYSIEGVFAALKADGQVVSWGAYYGRTSSAKQAELTPTIYEQYRALNY